MRIGLCASLAAIAAGCVSTPSQYDSPQSLRWCKGFGDGKSIPSLISVKGVKLLRAPADGCLTTGFNPRRRTGARKHDGIDLFYRGRSSAVAAAADGKVSYVGRMRGYGRIVIIKHKNDIETRYAHLSDIDGLKVGEDVRQGRLIGMTGRTGNASNIHLHYEIRASGTPINPLRH